MAKCPVGGCTDQATCPWYAVPELTGPGHEGWFRSEFGCTAWSSFESMTAQLPSDQWSMTSPASTNRNWNVSNVVYTFFGLEAVATGMHQQGAAAFKRQLYQSMIVRIPPDAHAHAHAYMHTHTHTHMHTHTHTHTHMHTPRPPPYPVPGRPFLTLSFAQCVPTLGCSHHTCRPFTPGTDVL